MVSTDEASRVLADLEADRIATRTAAAPPQWCLIANSGCLGILIALLAIPESLEWVQMSGVGIILVALIALIFWNKRRRTVRMDTFALFTPARLELIPVIVWVVVAFAVFLTASYLNGTLPWWTIVCGGLIVGILEYVIMSRAWKNWARTPA